MKGHRQIVQARKAGLRPAGVFFTIGPAPRMLTRIDVPVESRLKAGEFPEVFTDGDRAHLADLRWLIGLRVHLQGIACNNEEFWSWWDAVCEAKPALAIAVEPDGEVIEWRA